MIATATELAYELESQVWKNGFLLSKNITDIRIDKPIRTSRNTIFIIESQGSGFVFKQTKSHTLFNLEFFENEKNYYETFMCNKRDFFCHEDQKYFIFPKLKDIHVNDTYLKLVPRRDLNYLFLKSFVKAISQPIVDFHNHSNCLINRFRKKSLNSIKPEFVSFLTKYERFSKTGNAEYLLNQNIRFRESGSVAADLLNLLRCSKTKNALLNKPILNTEDLIHGDIALRNIMVSDNQSYQLIDFELVTFGDRLWDVVTLYESISGKILNGVRIQSTCRRFHLFNEIKKIFFDGNSIDRFIERFMYFQLIKRIIYLLRDVEKKNRGDSIVSSRINNLRQIVDRYESISQDLLEKEEITMTTKLLFEYPYG